MTEHLLHAAQIGTAIEQIGCESMAHVVRRQRFIETRCTNGLLEHLPHRVGSHPIAASGNEEIRRDAIAQQNRTGVVKIARHGVDAQIMQWDDALFPSFAENLHLPLREINVIELKSRRLRDSHAARIQELEYRLIAQSPAPLAPCRAVAAFCLASA